MKTRCIYFFLFQLVAFDLFFSEGGAALEALGCLTCHRYPGLVRPEENGTLTLLHIDPDAYFRSAHGELSCRECHVRVNRIPHAGDGGTDCRSGCHDGKNGRILAGEDLSKRIHEGEHWAVVDLQDESSCRNCHTIYPHSKTVFVRAVLNMHTGFVFCEVCHLNTEKYRKVTYGWIVTEDVRFEGKPFGTFYSPDKKKIERIETSISRIAAFVKEKGKKRPLIRTWNTDEEGKIKGHASDDEDSASAHDFHKDVFKMEVIRSCNACHSPKGLLDFRSLGFSKRRTAELISQNVKAIVTKYEAFHLPDLFGD